MSEQLGLFGIPPPEPMWAVSIRQPWPWLIIRPDISGEAIRRTLALEGHFKDVENRTFRVKHMGRLYIHAAAEMTGDDYTQAAHFAMERGVDELPPADYLPRGGLVGRVRMMGCVDSSTSRWFVGPIGWVLREPVAIDFAPCRAGPGIFDAEPLLRRERERQLKDL